MLTSIIIKNFGALKDFKMEGLASHNFLIGMNGSGRSSFFKAMEFLKALVTFGVHSSHEENYPAKHISKFPPRSTKAEFELTWTVGEKTQTWHIVYDLDSLTTVVERLEEINNGVKTCLLIYARNVVTIGKNSYHVSQRPSNPMSTEYRLFPEIVEAVSSAGHYSLMESEISRFPHSHFIAEGGEGLYQVVAGMNPKRRAWVIDRFRKVFPEVQSVKVKNTPLGAKILVTTDHIKNLAFSQMGFGAQKTLFFSLMGLPMSFPLLFVDHVGEGIDQERMKAFADLILLPDKQTFYIVDNGLLLNYLSDDVAYRGSHFFYNFADGVKTSKFFDSPNKLEFVGPGQAVSMENLRALAIERSSK